MQVGMQVWFGYMVKLAGVGSCRREVCLYARLCMLAAQLETERGQVRGRMGD
jgi:hypothetical protein